MTDTMPTDTTLEAAAAIRAHHAELALGLDERVTALYEAARRGAPIEPARDRVLGYLDAEIVPHAAAEEQTLYPAADAGPAALLVDAMRAEHRDLLARVAGLREAADPVAAVAGVAAIAALFHSHLDKENDRLLPALLVMPGVSLGDLLAGLHELVG
jgi:hypothetical protein